MICRRHLPCGAMTLVAGFGQADKRSRVVTRAGGNTRRRLAVCRSRLCKSLAKTNRRRWLSMDLSMQCSRLSQIIALDSTGSSALRIRLWD